jgi:hypothetical protein
MQLVAHLLDHPPFVEAVPSWIEVRNSGADTLTIPLPPDGYDTPAAPRPVACGRRARLCCACDGSAKPRQIIPDHTYEIVEDYLKIDWKPSRAGIKTENC